MGYAGYASAESSVVGCGRDAPGGAGKIPLLPEYVESIDDNEVVLRNYAGKRYVYRQPARASEPRPPTEFRPVSVG